MLHAYVVNYFIGASIGASMGMLQLNSGVEAHGRILK